ncbi:hypothetical protein CHH28_04090 [Bacterioplanes sanyensis]|uniref:DUF7878 domain-containing protein n=1 Tax=Bacterioplanes sanyensis TaxID=1249553 RepID=A0A222FFQ6_9GAMM|nr:hypothetical protein [Bacterioplanes sanyensis]ASP37905.1 hypothetical protein CHH28_04090 [Bacterioplanes sanyensis]
MEDISCEINYSIDYDAAYGTKLDTCLAIDGHLNVLVDDVAIFDEESICVSELYVLFSKWISTDFYGGFCYISMEHDEPVFEINIKGEVAEFESIWISKDVNSPILINKFSFFRAVSNFCQWLEKELPDIKNLL